MKIIFFCVLLVFSSNIFAQELDAKVIVNYEQLETAAREKLENFANEIEYYLNNTQFTGSSWDFEKIYCTFNIFFTNSAGEINYSAQMVVTSQREIYKSSNKSLMLAVMDNNWSFEYERGQQMYFDPMNFNSVTSLLDFYAYIVLGLDADSWEELGGSRYFEKAYDIVSRGAATKYSDSWERTSSSYNKFGLVDNLLNEKYLQFRKDYYAYHEGIDFFATNKKSSQDKIVRLIKNLEKDRDKIGILSVLLKVFFDAKYNEIVEYLKDYEDKNIFESLIKVDPAHISKYEEAKKG
ncbi:MAG: DUF4835 family protein [Ignavibacteriales bacterium]|nr:DUF4835 family protein [Ignavibacteriales bacterium]